MSKAHPLTGAPIVLDFEALAECQAAQQNIERQSRHLLETFTLRVDAEVVVTGEDRQVVARRIHAEDASSLEELKAKFEAAQTRLAAATRVYQFRSLGFRAWRALKAAHPSKDPKLAFDEDSLAPTLLREASYDPKLSAEMVEEILTSPDWSEGQVALLLDAAYRAQS